MLNKWCACLLVTCMLSAAVSASDMVEISVEVTEINNNKMDEAGISWPSEVTAGEVSNVLDTRVPNVMPDVPSVFQSGPWSRYTALQATLKLLEEKGVAQVLSKPRIATRSGTSAKIIVGGEMPIVASGVGGATIEWKEYGIKADILPRITADGSIDLKLTTEVSRLDYSINVAGYPGILKREAISSITVKSGETIAMAGMIETTKEEYSTGVPLLSDIPLLGYLFSTKQKRDTKKNVLIFVTPKILD